MISLGVRRSVLVFLRVLSAGHVDYGAALKDDGFDVRQVTVTHKPHARSASYAGGRPNWGETLQMWGAMRDRRAQVYFSTVADGNAWFANCTKKTNVSKLLGNFSKQILSQKPRWWRLFASQVTTDDFFKCMRTVSTRVPSHTIA